MKTEKFLKLIIICLLLLNIGVLGYMWVRKNNPRPPHERPGDHLVEVLDMTPAQHEQFDSLRHEHHELVMAHGKTMNEYRKAMYADLEHEPLPQKEWLNKIAGEQAAIDSITYDHFIRIRAMLNDGQKRKFDREFMHLLEQLSGHPGEVPPHGPPPPPEGEE